MLVAMAGVSGKIKNTADIAKLKFGEDCSVPADLLFNDVPHPAWVSTVQTCIHTFLLLSTCIHSSDWQ